MVTPPTLPFFSASGISAGAIAGAAIAVCIIILIIAAVTVVCLIKRKRAEKPEPNLIRGRGESTVSTMSAEMRYVDDEPYREPFRIGSPSTSGGSGMVAHGGNDLDGNVLDYPVKPGRVEPKAKAPEGNLYSTDPVSIFLTFEIYPKYGNKLIRSMHYYMLSNLLF